MAILKFSGKSAPAATVVSDDKRWEDERFVYAPEVVPATGPELAPGEAPEALYPTPDWSQLEKRDDGLDGATSPASHPWWKRKSVIISSVVACLLIIALAVGLGVGLTLNKTSSSSDSGSDTSNPSSDDNNNNNNNSGSGSNTNENKTIDINSSDGKGSPAAKVSCPGGLCQNILSLSVYQDDVFVVARSIENRVTIRPINTTLWDESYVDLEGTPGKLISQPASFSWKVNDTWPRLDVFAVSSPDYTVYRRHYSEAEGWAGWEAEGTDIGSSVAVCAPYAGKMDVWSTSQAHRSIYHDWWYQKDRKDISKSALKDGNTTEFGKMSEGENGWREESKLGKARTAPAVICRPTDIQADVLWYDNAQDELVHSAWDQNNEKWTAMQSFEGNFTGNPTVFTFGEEGWDFFGVQADQKMYHLGWTWNDGYSKLSSIGGSIASTPAAVSVKQGVIDVFALGTNGNLQHLHFDGEEWASEWEDLDIEASSAPSAVIHHEKVYITVVQKDGKLISLTRKADAAEVSWKGSLEQEVVGEEISLQYFSYDS